MIKKVLFFIMCFFFLIGYVCADEIAKNAKSAILIEASTGKVLYEKNADEALAPASMTKIMTLLLTMEAIEKGNIKLDDMVRVSKNAAAMGGSQVFLSPDTELKLEEIIKAVCIASGNDASYVLAEAIGGTHDNFVKMMNKKAKDLGLTSTNFVNAYGLDEKGHLSSARDMSIMARELIKHDLILKYSSIYEEYLKKPDGSSVWMVNTNKLVRFYNGVDGLKTGYTENAKYCLTATGKWNNMRLISVVMGEDSNDSRTDDTVAMLNYGKSSYKLNEIMESGKILGEVNVEVGDVTKSKIILSTSATDLVSTSETKKKYTYKVRANDIVAPIRVGDKVGEVEIFDGDKSLMVLDLTIEKDINKCSIFKIFKRIFSLLLIGSK